MPQRPYPAPLFIYNSPHSISLALCWAPGKHRYVSLFFSPRRSWPGGWWESKAYGFPTRRKPLGVVVGGGTEEGVTCPLFFLGKRQIPQRPVEAAGAQSSRPILPQASCWTTASASPKEGQGPWAGWRGCFPLCFTHNAPEKHFADM